ncbi:MAG: NAD(+) kinase [bacterium]|nr:NAD(+) kinase [bacterium]
MKPIKTIGIVANQEIPLAEEAVRRAMAVIRSEGGEILLDSSMAAWLGEIRDAGNIADFADRCQLFLVFGGDGTFLRAARTLKGNSAPLLGFNMGSLGFLTILRLSNIETALGPILRGEYRIEERMRLTAQLHRNGVMQGDYTALNDAVMHMSHGSRLVEFNISVGGQYLGVYRSDGLIVCTPTGSTAYSMSAGGPIVHPPMNALVATPICPHALSIRPIVVSAEEEIMIRIGARSGEAVLTLDGMVNVWLQQADEIRIRKADRGAPLCIPNGFSYYSLIREKLGWGVPDENGKDV